MSSFQKKGGMRRILESWPVLGFLTLLLLFFAWQVVAFLGKMEVTRQNRILAENKLAELQIQKAKLSSDIEKLKTIEGQEASIREKFGLAKEGEGEIVVVEDQSATPTSSGAAYDFFSFFKNLFK